MTINKKAMRKIDATKYTGFPMFLKRERDTLFVIDIDDALISKDDEIMVYGVPYIVKEVLETRKPKGDYKEFSDKAMFYKLKVS